MRIGNLTKFHILPHNTAVAAPQHLHSNFNRTQAAAQIRQPQYIWDILLCTGIHHIQFHFWKCDGFCRIQTQFVLADVGFIVSRGIQQHPYRKICGKGALRLCQQNQFIPNLNPQVVVLLIGENIFNCHQPAIRLRDVRVLRVEVQIQLPGVFGVAEQAGEYAVLDSPLHFRHGAHLAFIIGHFRYKSKGESIYKMVPAIPPSF